MYLNKTIKTDPNYFLDQGTLLGPQYIIGTYKATQWLGEETFNIINFIKEYENDNFGKVNTDFSDAEKVVNMYTYIIGEEIVQKYVEDMEKNKKVA